MQPSNRAQLLKNLDIALSLAENLRETCEKVFPLASLDSPAAMPESLSVEARLQLGHAAARELTAIAYQLAPEETLDLLEESLSGNTAAQQESVRLMSRLSQSK